MNINGEKFESELTKKISVPFDKEKAEAAYIREQEIKQSRSTKGLKNVPFTPTNNGVIVAYEAVEKTEGGIIISKEDSLSEDELEVLAVGPAVKDLKPGDIALARAEAKPIQFTYKGLTYLHFREHDFIVVINK
jgi:co-chaperonin GroES (HSP10)